MEFNEAAVGLNMYPPCSVKGYIQEHKRHIIKTVAEGQGRIHILPDNYFEGAHS